MYSETLFETSPQREATPSGLKATWKCELKINVLIYKPSERPSLLKATFLTQKGWPHKSGSTADMNI